MNDYENDNNENNINNNIIHLTTPELTTLTHCYNENHDPMDLNNGKQNTELEVLNLHKNLCMELLAMGKGKYFIIF